MRGPVTLVVALVLFGTVVAVPASGLHPAADDGTPSVADAPASVPFQQDETTPENETANETDENGTFAPGERLAGVVGVQGAEVSGEVASRAYGIRIAEANSDRTRASVLAAEYNDSARRLETLRQRKQNLTRQFENGTLSTGAYHARLAQLTAQIRTLERIVNQTEAAAATLPPQALARQGVNATEIRGLRTEARNLSGLEGAAAARAVAGPAAGRSLARGPPNGTSPGRSGEAPGQSGTARSADGPPGTANETTTASGRSQEVGPPAVNETSESTGANATAVGDDPPATGASDGTPPSDVPPPANESVSANESTAT